MNTTTFAITNATALAGSLSGFATCGSSWEAFIGAGTALLISEVLPLIPSKYMPAGGIVHGVMLVIEKLASKLASKQPASSNASKV
jgi:hypothetical protein